MAAEYSRALEVAERTALMAGEMLRAEFHRPGGARGGRGKAPIDTEAEEMIRRELLKAFPNWGYRGEETHPDTESADGLHVWLVDPNDGTSAFLQGYRGSAVSIGLVCEGTPVLGVIYAFVAPDDRGDLFTWAAGCGPFRRNGKPCVREPWPEALDPHCMVLLSKGAEKKPQINARLVAPARFRAVPSIACRMALAAAGEGVATLSINSPGDWDYAAGHALIRGAGGDFVNESGETVTYTRSGRSWTQLCFAGSPRIARDLSKLDWGSASGAAILPSETYDLVRPEPGRNVSDPGILSRAQGCWLGQLAGDALGSLVEFRSAADIERHYPERVRYMQDGGTWNTLAGQPTDDSEMALALARSIVQDGRYDPEAAAAAYHYWYKSGPFDCGSTTASALGAITDDSVRSRTAAAAARRAANPASQANGSLMRISPLAIWGHSLPADVLADHARSDAVLTHPHPVCREAAALYCVAIARALAAGGTPSSIYDHAVHWAEGNVREKIVLAALRSAEAAPPENASSQQGWVLIALRNAFYRLLHSASLEQGIVDTVMAGGDTDTNAAIAGALLGSVHGRGAVPCDWMQMVLSCRPMQGFPGVHRPRPRAFWPIDALGLAERLLL